uniref:transmembrane protein 131-like n=1 Tax=Halichoerus grypus TaxID=9711 RepID=UPI00165955B3|nr:transmembrane protein 131-like [Halichoerus grypus]
MAGLRRPQPGCYCRTAAAVNLLLGVFQVLLPCCRPGGAQGQAIEPLPNVVELWQAEEGELLLPTQGDSEENMEEHSQEQRVGWEKESTLQPCAWFKNDF